MRILKTKIANARRSSELQAQQTKLVLLEEASVVNQQKELSLHSYHCRNLREKTQNSNKKSRKPLTSNNIMKNYSRALANFALSDIAEPYVMLGVQEQNVPKSHFGRFIRKDKQKLNCIQSLRNKLLIFPDDTDSMMKCKKVFQSVCVAFLKNFSVKLDL